MHALVVVALFLLQPNVVRSEEVGSPWSYWTSTFLMSKYYGTYFGGTFYDGPMSFTDFVASRKNHLGAFTVDLSIGQKLDRINQFNKDGGNEYDLTASQTFSFGTKRYPVNCEVGLCYLALHPLENWGDDALSIILRVNVPIRADRPEGAFCEVYAHAYDYRRSGNMRDDGWFVYGGVFRDQKLGCTLFGKELALNIDYRVGASAGVYNSEPGVEYHRVSLSLPISKGKWTFIPSIVGQLPGASHQTYVHDPEVFGSLFIKRSF
jgi:hypothetical protein